MFADDRIVNAVVERCAQIGARTCVDVGCGEGRQLVELSRSLVCAGVDVEPEMLARADRRLDEAEQSALLLTADATKLPFGSGTVDAVTMFDVVGQLPDVATAFGEAARVLRVGGLFAFDAYMPAEPAAGGVDAGQRRFERGELGGLLPGWAVEIGVAPRRDRVYGDLLPRDRKSWLVFATAMAASGYGGGVAIGDST